MSHDQSPHRSAYAGLFLVALATLMYEILLTRIFSVTLWYHFAFVAISVAMFGMTVGANLVFLLPRYFTPERTGRHLAASALAFAVSMVWSFLTHLSIPFLNELSVLGVYSVALNFAVLAVPFVFSGVCVCLALTRFPRQVSQLYAADLTGAAIGCVLLVYTLKVTDGPTAVIVVAALASLGAVGFAAGPGGGGLSRAALLTTCVLATGAALHTVLVQMDAPALRLTWIKGQRAAPPLYERWNSFSQITVEGDATTPSPPFGWGLSSVYPRERGVRQLEMKIDAAAGTILTAYDGRLGAVEHLKYDVVNIAHHLRRDGRVLVIGTGGGRDILSALAFGQRAVVGVEINENILDTVNGVYGDFTGHLDRDPRVRFVNDEARSYIARQRDRFDIIQASLIDTWAATAAGAFVLTENSLYTVEAWKIFLERLTPDGLFTVSRWYYLDRPDEMYRLTALASASVMAAGIAEPRRHIVIVRRGHAPNLPANIGTMVVSRAPFSDRDLDQLEAVARDLRFEVTLSPRTARDDTFVALTSGPGLAEFTARYPINITAPTDDKPFFFHMLWLRDVLRARASSSLAVGRINMQAVATLATLLVTVFALSALCIFLPLALTTRRAALRNAGPLLLFFCGIGFGFMLVEISQMQRLTVFLGHPTYSLAVVLFSLLTSTGIGSHLTRHASPAGGSALACLGGLLGALALFGILTPYAIAAFQDQDTWVRILVACGILFPLGLAMGTAFPLGMKLASGLSAPLTPWFWGINGATSVCASVLGVVISLHAGISVSFWTGLSWYVLACAAFLAARRSIARGDEVTAKVRVWEESPGLSGPA
jgi:hypothetical protein